MKVDREGGGEDGEGAVKRMRKMEMGSEIRSAIEELSRIVKVESFVSRAKNGGGDDDGRDEGGALRVPTRPFLSLCNLVVQVLDKIGPTMAVLRLDIDQNVQRLESLRESDPSRYSDLVEILRKEAGEGNARKSSSCSRAIVWLTRSMDFTVALLQRLAEDPGQRMEQAVEESYDITFKPWHGWISSAAFKVALKLVPESKSFISLFKKKDESYENFKEDIRSLISSLSPVLEEIHSMLKNYSVDRLKSI